MSDQTPPITAALRDSVNLTYDTDRKAWRVTCDEDDFRQMCDQIDAVDANLASELQKAKQKLEELRSEQSLMEHALERMSGEVARNLRTIMAAKGVSQAELAHRMHVSNSCVSRWYWGATEPNRISMLRLCRVLGCNVEDITGNGKGV